MYKKYKKRNTKLILNFILIICIILSICILSIGYADITSTNLSIIGTASAEAYVGMFISNVEHVSNNGADLTNSKIEDYTGTMLHSNIYLSPTDSDSSITYAVTIFNNSDAIKKFTGVTYADGFYSNSNIKYSLDGILLNDIIEKGNSKTFNITFYYSSTTITNNQLESYLNFNFDYYLEGENEVDILMSGTGTYNFAGVSPESPIDLKNIANITFSMKNGNEQPIIGFRVDVMYTPRSGSSQSATITLADKDKKPISTKSIQFQGKKAGTNLTVEVIFDNLNVGYGEVLSVSFDQGTITNGKVDTTGVSITPILGT